MKKTLFFVSLPDAFGRIRDGKSASSAGHHIGGDVFYPPDTYALCAAVSGATSKSVSCGHRCPLGCSWRKIGALNRILAACVAVRDGVGCLLPVGLFVVGSVGYRLLRRC